MPRLEFAGTVPYLDHWKGDPGARVVIGASVRDTAGDPVALEFIVDTGAPWTIIDPELRGLLPGMPLNDTATIICRGHKIQGSLFRIPIIFGAPGFGEVEIDATVLYPQLPLHDGWDLPNFLGLSALNRLRWALEPERTLLYFARCA